VTLLRYLDVVAPTVFSPIAVLFGAPAAGYAAGVLTWLALRLLGRAVGGYAGARGHAAQLAMLRLAYRLVRVVLLVVPVVLVRKWLGDDDGFAALLVIVFAFTIDLVASVLRHDALPGSPARARRIGVGAER
jgi:hypothetical protein